MGGICSKLAATNDVRADVSAFGVWGWSVKEGRLLVDGTGGHRIATAEAQVGLVRRWDGGFGLSLCGSGRRTLAGK